VPEVRDGAALDAHLRLRAELIEALRDLIQRRGLRQREAAALFGVAQPRVSDLVRGKLSLFSLDTLVGMLAAAGVTVELHLRPRDGNAGARSRPPTRRQSRLKNAQTKGRSAGDPPSS
jgi:predicted XRE-type DNA-binding protein